MTAGLVKVQPQLRKTLADKAGINSLRITDMMVSHFFDKKLFII